MAYNQKLTDKIREALSKLSNVEEQEKMGGFSFMINDKVCIRAHSNGDTLIRCEPAITEEFLKKKGVRRFEMKGKTSMKGWLLISPEVMKNKKNFDYWISVALDYNKKLKA